jgi:hypothetical protein
VQTRIILRGYGYGFRKRLLGFLVSRRDVMVDASLFRIQRCFVLVLVGVVVVIGHLF